LDIFTIAIDHLIAPLFAIIGGMAKILILGIGIENMELLTALTS
jgi:hypothetical protein